jgi:NAD+ kinase
MPFSARNSVVRVGFVLKHDKPQALEIARDLVPWLAQRGCEPVVTEEHHPLLPDIQVISRDDFRDLDLIVCLGGDGTLLHASSMIKEGRAPVLGINLGRLGFLVPFSPADARTALEQALDGKLPVEERMRLSVRLHRNGGEVVERLALNDAVISQGAMARLIEVLARLDGKRITLYKADGLIVSTPSGSTAYNLAAGGPILSPGQSSVAITPICPHTLTNRPLVVPGTSRIEVELTGESRSVILTVDGQTAYPLEPGDKVEITQAAAPLRVYASDKPYFEILREKLRWGER